MRSRVALLCVLFAAAAFRNEAATRNPADYTRVLLPFTGVTVGANGAWIVEWWFRNPSNRDADAFPLAFGCGLPPPPVNGETPVFVLGSPALPANTTPTCPAGDALPAILVPPAVPLVSEGQGALLYVETAALPQLQISGNLAWRQFGAADRSARLRAIPESQFARGTGSIFAVPVLSANRYAIRIYALPESASDPHVTVSVVELRPFGIPPPQPELAQFETDLGTPKYRLVSCIGPCDLPDVPYAPPVAQLFNLVSTDHDYPPSTVRIDITPRSPQLRWWAVVSATSNTTGEILLYDSTP
jgi:hypothetical protein